MEELFEATKHVYDEFKSSAHQVSAAYHEMGKTYTGNPDDLYEEEKEAIKDLWSNVYEKFNEEYHLYMTNNTYFYGCAFSVYENLYDERLRVFLENTIETNEIDFIELELKEDKKPYNEYWLDEKAKLNIISAVRKRNELLTNKALGYGYEIKNNKLSSVNELSRSLESKYQEEPEPGEYSLQQKIILLDKLGILKHLRTLAPFKQNRNALSGLVGRLVGEKQNTVEPVIRALDLGDKSRSAHPSCNEKNELKVDVYLASLGIEKSE
ncbi:hypothetical protein N8211_02360 [Flavobacteriaceae bacterium]|jgi:hypothetical protein|nr:hypothetical protein [Flavobacteriaceae bacterium]|tara:strand:+ start:4250 stop:5050 length:801 start_codon:yes stop_codon:yes gene_type:complete